MIQPAQPTLSHLVASASREELHLIGRIKALRLATEKLPQNWKSSNLKDALTKDILLHEIEAEESRSAERWNILTGHVALIYKKNESNARLMKVKKSLDEWPQLYSEINRRLDDYNIKVKSGILENLTTRLTTKNFN